MACSMTAWHSAPSASSRGSGSGPIRGFNRRKMNPTVSATFQLSRLMGLLPFSHSAELRASTPSARITILYSNCWAVYALIVVTTYMILVLAINFDYIKGGKRRGDDWITNPYNLTLYLTQIGLQGLALVIHLLMVTIKKKDLAAIFRHISQIKSATPKPRLTPGFYTIVGILWVFGCYMAWLVIGSSDRVPWYVFVCPMISDVICLVIVLQFCTVLSPIEAGFAQIAATLRAKGPKFTQHLMTKHSLLIEQSVFINKFYSKQLVVVMSLAVINYIGWTYFAVQSVLSEEPDYLLGGSQFQMALYQMFLIFYTCRCCSAITREANSFNDELFGITCQFPNMANKVRNICYTVKVMLYMSLKHTVHFTGCGFFTFDYPLVSSILGTATTYIVILIQFSMQHATASLARQLHE